MLDYNLVLKSDELYLVGNISTDGSGESAKGLYTRDTRHLSRFEIALNGVPLDLLSAQTLEASKARVTATNGVLTLADGSLVHPHMVAVEQQIELRDDVRFQINLENFAQRTLPIVLSITAAADFRDLFDIRGFTRQARGQLLPPRLSETGITLCYRGLDGLEARTEISFDRPAAVTPQSPLSSDGTADYVVLLPGFDRVESGMPASQPAGATARFVTTVAAGARWDLRVTVAPCPAGGVPLSAAPTLDRGTPSRAGTITTDVQDYDRIFRRGASDLEMLQTSFPEGSLPAGGIPWYVAPFGRDSLIVGLQTLFLRPEHAAGTLRVLAALQGTKVDEWRDEEPGKIPHEMRYGEMARRHEVPHSPYYGTVDATPLFVLLFADTVAWTGSQQLYDDLLPNARRALDWIERYGDRDGDGFVEYQTRDGRAAAITHQGWKDSFDSLNFEDGRPVSGSVALVEVQGYVYAAYQRLAEVAFAFGDPAWSEALTARAITVREAVERAFWLESDGFYAQALADDKSPVRTISSNPGHLLYCGLPTPERAARVAARLLESDMFSGWGVRTLSTSAPTYNPMSYHNGSVWPHDNSLIVAGLYDYGQTEAASRIARAVLAAAATEPLLRLPELYCGFARTSGLADAPVDYPVSCSPQAWAAAAPALMIRGMLGLGIEIATGRLLTRPALPAWLSEVAVDNMVVRGQSASLTVRRCETSYDVVLDGEVPAAVS